MLRRLIICVTAAMVLLPAALAFSNTGGPSYAGCAPGDTREGNSCVAYAFVTRTFTFVLPNFETVTRTATKTSVVKTAGGTTTVPGGTVTSTRTVPGTTTTVTAPDTTTTLTSSVPGTTATETAPGETDTLTETVPGSTVTDTATETETTTTTTTTTTTATEVDVSTPEP
ncbi:MAG TPA: hypothetical protein VHX66_14275 [Solirubrobacteraceae bacterium]|jgi:hypothetical protein|nr:hypothetical protein [Solirubrobacteraceae bacterium]